MTSTGGMPSPSRGGADATDGLTAAEAVLRLGRDGPNVLPQPPRTPAWRRLAAQIVHFFALLLWAAAVLAIVADLPQLGVAIVVVVVVNGVFAFAQEERAERAAEALRDLLPAAVTVRRSGQVLAVAASEVVVGDRVLLAAGDRVPADLALDRVAAATLDESMLTGESVPVPVDAGDLAHAGTFVVTGEGEGTAVATGGRTRLAEIATLTTEVVRPRSPLAVELDRVVRTIALLALGIGAAFMAASAVLGTPLRDAFLLSIGVTVALVPEGLLPTVTLSLAIGAQRMAHRNALVRHLEAVETLGSTTFICTDKTGTLTRNAMGVVEVWTAAGPVRVGGSGYEPTALVDGSGAARARARRAARAARLASEGRAAQGEGGAWIARGDPMEAAIDALAHRLDDREAGDAGDDELFGEGTPLDAHHPFDTDRRRESVVASGWLLAKGAPEALVPRCTPRDGVGDAIEDMAGRGLRVLAVAARPTRPGDDDLADPA